MPEHDFDEQPDASWIYRHRQHLQDVWRETHAKWQEYDSYYNRTYDLWGGADKQGLERPDWLRPARPTSIVDNAVDNQLASDPKPHRFPARDTDESKQWADQVELGLKAILDEAALQETTLTWKTLGKYLVHYGYAICEVGLDSRILQKRSAEPEQEAGEEEEDFERRKQDHEHYRRSAMPFRTRAPHPVDVLLDPSEKRPQVAIKHNKRYAIDLHNLTRLRQKRGRKADLWEVGQNPWELIETDEYWTEIWHALMASKSSDQGQLLFVERNTWLFVPYGHAFAGFGLEPAETTERNPVHLAVGILDSVMADIRAQGQAVSGRHNALMDATFNPIGTRIPAEELRNQLDQGNILEMQDRGDVWRMEIPQLPRWMFQTEEWLARDIEEGTYSRALSGIREQGVSTVGQQAILSTAAGRKFVAVSRQLEHLATVAGSQILQLIDVLDFDLTIRGHRIRPQYIERDYTVQVTFDLVDPVLQLQEREIGMREVQLGLKSKETYLNADAKLEDISGEQRRLLMDWVRANPLVHQAMAMEVARAEGIDRLLERAMNAATGPSSPQGGNGGGLSGLVGPDGQPLGQSMGQTGGAPRAVDQLRQALTPQTMNPGRNGANLAG